MSNVLKENEVLRQEISMLQGFLKDAMPVINKITEEYGD